MLFFVFILIHIVFIINYTQRKIENDIQNQSRFMIKYSEKESIEPNECRQPNEVDFDAKPLVIALHPNSHKIFNWGSRKVIDIPNCDINCAYTKNFDKNSKRGDGLFHYFKNEKATKQCKHQKSIHYVMETWPEKDGFDIYAATESKSDVYASYYLYQYDLMKPPIKKETDYHATVFISNCEVVTSGRFEVIEELEKYGVKILKYGRCFKNILLAKGSDLYDIEDRVKTKLETMAKYKFNLAFENTILHGYISEKLWEPLMVGSVPVLIGPKNIHKFEPKQGSVLSLFDYKNVEELAKEIIRLSDNEKDYNKMLEWKKTGPSDSFLAMIEGNLGFWCQICISVADQFQQLPEVIDQVFVREYGKYYYKKVPLAHSLLKFKQNIYDAFEFDEPKYARVNEKEFSYNRDKLHQFQTKFITNVNFQPVRRRKKIYRIVRSGLNFEKTLWSGDSIDSNEKVKNMKQGERFDVIFV